MKKILIGMAGFLMLVGGIAIGDGTAQTTYTISGQVIDSRVGIGGIGGVTMTGLPGNPTPTTDANGYYLGTVPTNWSGTVKPEKIGYAIHPASQIYSNVASDLTMNFGATLLPKAAVVPVDPGKTTYYPGEPISITMTIENQGGDIITSKGFKEKNFHLTLWFTDPDGKLITTNVETGFTPPPPSVTPIVIDNKVQLLPIEYVETVPASWVLSTTFNALDYYTLTKSGNYSVKARFDMSDYLEIYETAPGSGIFYAPLESASSGYVESNIISFTLLAKANQTITVTQEPPANAIYNTSFTVGATASSGLTVSVGASGACSINGNTITMTSGTGTCSITFDQAGDATYNAAPQVTRSVTAQKASQTITFAPLSNKTYGDPPFTVSASASSGLSVSFSILSGPATILGNTVTVTGVGTVTVRASQAGNANWNPATPVDQSFQVAGTLLDHITISPASATIIAGGSQSYTAQGFDANNNSLGDVTSATAFSITPNGSCTGNTCTATVGGAHTVTGNDSGKTATASLQVNYSYAGFFSPIDNPPTVNAAKAGQAIPVKWRLTNANGIGISDTGSFKSLTSYGISCTTLTGPVEVIPEETSSTSGLQYLGDGNWQYNWKTSKGYANTCRRMILDLKDGTQHTVDFKFK